jgi:hypothetical protein
MPGRSAQNNSGNRGAGEKTSGLEGADQSVLKEVKKILKRFNSEIRNPKSAISFS